jgi:hypothetical protein
MAAERALFHPDGPGRAWQSGAPPETGLSLPQFLGRSHWSICTQISAVLFNEVLQTWLLLLQVQEDGLLLPEALVWQVLWEVAQVRSIEKKGKAA